MRSKERLQGGLEVVYGVVVGLCGVLFGGGVFWVWLRRWLISGMQFFKCMPNFDLKSLEGQFLLGFGLGVVPVTLFFMCGGCGIVSGVHFSSLGFASAMVLGSRVVNFDPRTRYECGGSGLSLSLDLPWCPEGTGVGTFTLGGSHKYLPKSVPAPLEVRGLVGLFWGIFYVGNLSCFLVSYDGFIIAKSQTFHLLVFGKSADMMLCPAKLLQNYACNMLKAKKQLYLPWTPFLNFCMELCNYRLVYTCMLILGKIHATYLILARENLCLFSQDLTSNPTIQSADFQSVIMVVVSYSPAKTFSVIWLLLNVHSQKLMCNLLVIHDSNTYTPGDHFWHLPGKLRCRGVPIVFVVSVLNFGFIKPVCDPSLNIIMSSPVRLLNGRYIATQHKNLIKKNDYTNIQMVIFEFLTLTSFITFSLFFLWSSNLVYNVVSTAETRSHPLAYISSTPPPLISTPHNTPVFALLIKPPADQTPNPSLATQLVLPPQCSPDRPLFSQPSGPPCLSPEAATAETRSCHLAYKESTLASLNILILFGLILKIIYNILNPQIPLEWLSTFRSYLMSARILIKRLENLPVFSSCKYFQVKSQIKIYFILSFLVINPISSFHSKSSIPISKSTALMQVCVSVLVWCLKIYIQAHFVIPIRLAFNDIVKHPIVSFHSKSSIPISKSTALSQVRCQRSYVKAYFVIKLDLFCDINQNFHNSKIGFSDSDLWMGYLSKINLLGGKVKKTELKTMKSFSYRMRETEIARSSFQALELISYCQRWWCCINYKIKRGNSLKLGGGNSLFLLFYACETGESQNLFRGTQISVRKINEESTINEVVRGISKSYTNNKDGCLVDYEMVQMYGTVYIYASIGRDISNPFSQMSLTFWLFCTTGVVCRIPTASRGVIRNQRACGMAHINRSMSIKIICELLRESPERVYINKFVPLVEFSTLTSFIPSSLLFLWSSNLVYNVSCNEFLTLIISPLWVFLFLSLRILCFILHHLATTFSLFILIIHIPSLPQFDKLVLSLYTASCEPLTLTVLSLIFLTFLTFLKSTFVHSFNKILKSFERIFFIRSRMWVEMRQEENYFLRQRTTENKKLREKIRKEENRQSARRGNEILITGQTRYGRKTKESELGQLFSFLKNLDKILLGLLRSREREAIENSTNVTVDRKIIKINKQLNIYKNNLLNNFNGCDLHNDTQNLKKCICYRA
ncbi:hypothetical protein VP01_185g4 [Puccinia sorghi]|uniref:Uncharacterized protein n=1 Tax=Puccinia sorghi TaxID=27349 RepID=A0A0L6VE03_9BASI|nr:hypothetical protein VP01_185g4 [Puccinia sorghi]